MLKKIYRLSSVNLANAKNVSGSLFNLKLAKNDLEISRFGFVISKKLDKRATGRNLLKRKLSSSVEEIFDRIEGGWDLVFYPKTICIEVPKEAIAEELRKTLEKEKIIND